MDVRDSAADEAPEPSPLRSVPRWEAAIALLGIGLIYLALPPRLRVGPSWLVLAGVVVALVPLFALHFRGHSRAAHLIGRVLTALVVLSVASSAAFLVARLPGAKTSGSDLLRDTVLTWSANVLAFALVYWDIDAGGPGRRRLGSYQSSDFVFPQVQQNPALAARTWMPEFVDYLFLAFNTSTAFSPTDTLVFSRRAKLLMMVQSLISLVVIAVLAARAINTL